MQKTLGKYGLIYRNYLKECKQKLYQNLKENGSLLDHCCEREQELKQLYERIEKQLKEKNPRPKTDKFMEIVHYETGIANMVHEFVMDNISL